MTAQLDLFANSLAGGGSRVGLPTPAEIEAAKTQRGGWKRATLAQWGVPWPPPRGWRRRLIAQSEGSYPLHPGHKAESSRSSGDLIAPHAKTVRRAALAAFVAAYPSGMTADELAGRLGESILTTRPRVSELHAAGLIQPTPQRRQNDSGHTATVWIATRAAFREPQS
jgi:hypothetical protein